MPAKELDKRTDHGAGKPRGKPGQPTALACQAQFLLQFAFQASVRCGDRVLRFGNHQGRDDANAHQAGHGEIRVLPGLCRGNVKRTGAGHEQGHPVAEYVAGGHRSLQQALHRLDAVCVDSDVLGGRPERDQQRKDRERLQVRLWVTRGHPGQAQGNQDLGRQHPGTPLAQPPGQKKDRCPVHHRRPEHLDRVGNAYPTEKTDGGQGQSRIPQPRGQGGKYQQERQPRRKTEQAHGNDPGSAVHRQGGAPVPAA